MILNGCSSVSVGASLDFKSKSKSYNTTSPSIPRTSSKVAFSSIRSSWVTQQEPKYCCPRGIPHLQLAASSSPLMIGDLGLLPRSAPRQSGLRRTLESPKALLKFLQKSKYPPMTKKPMFWWRSLACIPYLMPLHETWMYAETAYHLHPFLEDLEYLTYPFLGTIGRLPGWFLMGYFFCAYLGVVRRKEWPHYFRFHVVMGMLLEITMQVFGTVSRWLPRGVYWGKVGMHLWTAIAFGFLFTVLECMRCALSGMYADVPLLSNAAYIQIPYAQEKTE